VESERNQHEQISSVERQEKIFALVQSLERTTVAQICEQFNVSEATARRDLERLAEQNKVRRVHGGALRIQKAPPEQPVIERKTAQLEEKKRIGFGVARLIEDGQTVFLGSGTTVLEVAKNLHGKRKLTVITNSLFVINELADEDEITLVSIGGILRKSEYSFIGHITEKALEELWADRVSTAFVAPIERMNLLVTTREALDEFIRSLKSRGVDVLLV
jgi:DeoR family transcriptional regulator of aga operon